LTSLRPSSSFSTWYALAPLSVRSRKRSRTLTQHDRQERETKYWSDLDIDKLITRANAVMAEEQIYTHLCVVCSSIIIVLMLVLVVAVFVVLLCLLALTLSARAAAAAAAIQRSSQELQRLMQASASSPSLLASSPSTSFPSPRLSSSHASASPSLLLANFDLELD
jgi:hypothetical protein